MNLTAAQIYAHSLVCEFEQKTGIEIIRMHDGNEILGRTD
jgi:hypothetical protein